MRRLPIPLCAMLALAATMTAGCSDSKPGNGQLRCGAEPNPCPAGQYCSPLTGTCWLLNTGPDAGLPGSKDGGADTVATPDLMSPVDRGGADVAPVDVAADGVSDDAPAVDLALADAPTVDPVDGGPDAPIGVDAPGVDAAGTCPTGQSRCNGECVVIPAGGCCAAAECAGSCMTCGADHKCTAVKNGEDPNRRCTGICDATGVCKKKPGQSCQATPADCVAGSTCSPDGICCDRACTGSCEACDLPGKEGTCTTLAANAAPHSGHNLCVATDSACAGKCDGNSAACFYTTAACGSPATCTSAVFQAQGACKDGACKVPAPETCSNACVLPGGCTGVCVPNTVQCSAQKIPQKCSASGSWQDQTPCGAGFDCVAGMCTCSKSLCGAACVDLTNDAQNCGACGHSCGGGTCSNSKCQTVALASGLSSPGVLGVDAQYVYYQWFLEGTWYVSRVGATGAASPLSLGSFSGATVTFNGIISPSDGTNTPYLVWTRGYEKRICSLKTETSCATSDTSISGLDAYEWFTKWRSPSPQTAVSYLVNGGSATYTWRAAPDGRYAASVTDSATSFGFAVPTGNLIYWIHTTGTSSTLLSASSSGGVKSTLSSGLSTSVSIADANAQSVLLWDINSSTGIGTLSRLAAQTTGAPQTVTTIVSPPTSLTATEDATSVYWFDGNGNLLRCPSTNCTSTTKVTLATGQNPTGGLFQDSSSLYWANGAPGSIVRLAK